MFYPTAHMSQTPYFAFAQQFMDGLDRELLKLQREEEEQQFLQQQQQQNPSTATTNTNTNTTTIKRGAVYPIQAEYVWIGGNRDSSSDMRCKTRTMPHRITHVSQLPEWNYDGSSTNQAAMCGTHFSSHHTGRSNTNNMNHVNNVNNDNNGGGGGDSECLIRPVAIFRDPFRKGHNLLVMCDTYDSMGRPLPSNTRHWAKQVFDRDEQHQLDPWFGIEQEYTLFNLEKHPLGWPKGGFPGPQGPYYCSVGSNHAFGRFIVECHYKACLYAGVNISGINAEVMPGQWEFQVGPCHGIEVGDHVWMARYLLHRIGEMFDVIVSFAAKPIAGDWNGAGAHTNFSTRPMREQGGYPVILKAIERLSHKHQEHIAVYGVDNHERLTGRHETASMDKFSYGVANRGASVRIPRSVERDQRGYFEDRRPAASADPYVLSAKLFETCCLVEEGEEDEVKNKSSSTATSPCQQQNGH